jgi:general secretion pathway protein J
MNRSAKGFTLLEVLIALGIVSVISILSWQGLQEVLRSTSRVTAVDEQLQTVSAVFSQFEKDLGALELTLNSPNPEGDLIEITGTGLLIQFTQRNTSEPAYRERVEWVLDGAGLLRIARRQANPELPSISDPIATRGMQVRLLREPGGWSSPVVFGNHTVQERTDLELKGPTLQLNNDIPGQRPPQGAEGGTTGAPEPPAEQTVTSLVRAVEISLTQPNNQAVTRVFLTGGVY